LGVLSCDAELAGDLLSQGGESSMNAYGGPDARRERQLEQHDREHKDW
jgi:hypothetical protein